MIIPLLIVSVTLACLSGNRLRFPDEVDYHQLGQSLTAGNGFSLQTGEATVYRPPGYPFFLSPLYHVCNAPLTGKLANTLLLAISVWLMCRITKNSLPGLFVFAYPILLFTASTLYPQTLGTFLLLGIIWLLLYPEQRNRALILSGLCLGFLILNIPAFLLTAPVLAWILYRHEKGPVFQRLARVCLLSVCTLLVVLPWTWRNYKTFDAFLPISANSGLNLFFGNSPHTGPNTGVNVDRTAVLVAVEDMNEIETDHYYRDQALEWIRTHPVDAAKLYAAKAVNYFNFKNELKTTSQSSTLKNALMFVTWTPLLGLFVIRLFFYKKYPLSELEKAIYLLVICNVFLSAIFFTRIRFRLPFDMLMILSNSIFAGAYLQDRGFFAHKPLTTPENCL